MSCRPRLLLRSFPCSFRCVWRLAARRIRPARSSGRANLAPFDRRISSKLRPVASRTLGTPKPSRRRTPIAAAERPSWCRRKIVSSISAFSIATHSGFALRNGLVDPLLPLRCAWRRAIISSEEAAHTAGTYLRFTSRARDRHDAKRVAGHGPESFFHIRRGERPEKIESTAAQEIPDAPDRVCLYRMELVEQVEHSLSSENKESELDGQPARSRIESGLFETNDLEALLPDVRPRLKRGRSCGRAMPEFEHEKAVRFEMSAEAAEGLQRVSFRQQISEGPEHAHSRVERSAESERAHVGTDEPGSHT